MAKVKDKLYAVVTGDVVESMSLSQEKLSLVMDALTKEMDELYAARKQNGMQGKGRIFGGDSCQWVTSKPEFALIMALQLYTGLRTRLLAEPVAVPSSVRIAIGIGTADVLRENVLESNGEAFVRSGRGLQDMKKSSALLNIISHDAGVNAEWETQCRMLDEIVRRWTDPQVQVIYLKLRGLTETEIAHALNATQPAINQRSQTAGWGAVEMMIRRYTQITIQMQGL